ncbi:MAG: GGDEF domain-containing protein [Lachnospiraceae bacterium]|nr:GGDEF domain-containing protein [Lachnospiraceae bacterium]
MSLEEPFFLTGAIQLDYFVASCDKSCADYLKIRPHRSLPDLMTKESGDLLKDACKRILSGEEAIDLILDMEYEDNVYHPFHFHLIPSGDPEIVLFTASDIYLSERNLLRIRDSFEEVIEFIERMGYYAFRYTKSTGIFTIQKCKDLKPVDLFSGQLSDFTKELCDGKVPDEDRAKVGAFQELLEGQLENCAALFHTSFFSKGNNMQLMQFSGSTHTGHDGQTHTSGYVMQVKDASHTPVFPLRDPDIDAMTQLLSKNGIRSRAEKALSDMKDGENVWLTICDIDDFKNINDTYGHAFGDEVIKAVARCIKAALGEHGKAGRFGGDEFFFYTENLGEIEMRSIFAEIKRTIEWEVRKIEHTCRVTLSIGTVPAPLNGREYDELFEKADKSVYIAKGKGKDRFIIYREEMHGNQALPEGESEIKFETGYSLRLAALMADISDSFLDNGPKAIRPSLEKVKEKMALDSVRVFAGSKLSCVYSSASDGLDEISQETAESIASSRSFDKNGFLKINNAAWIRETEPRLFEWFVERNAHSAVFYLERDDEGKIDFLVSYEYLVKANSRNWAGSDPNFLLMFSRLISKTMRKNKLFGEKIS